VSNKISPISSPLNRALSYLPQSSLWNNRVVALIGLAGAVSLIAFIVHRFLRQAPTSPPEKKGPALTAPTVTISSSSSSAPPSAEPTRTADTPVPTPAAASSSQPTSESTSLAAKPADAFFAQLFGNTANAKANSNIQESALGIFRISTEGVPEKTTFKSSFPIFAWLFTQLDDLYHQNTRPATRVDDTLETVARLPLHGRVQLGVIEKGSSFINEVPPFEVEQRSAIYYFYFRNGQWSMRTETRELPKLEGPRFQPKLDDNEWNLTTPFSLNLALSDTRLFSKLETVDDNQFFILQNNTEELHILSFEIEGTVQIEQPARQTWETNVSKNAEEKVRLAIPITLPPGCKLPLRKSFWEESYTATLGAHRKLLNRNLTLVSIQDSATPDIGMTMEKIPLS
jgi:hypothetical protein